MLITIILFSLFFSAVFSGTEIAFISASKVKIELLRNRKTRRARILAYFYDQPAEFLGMLLVGNNIMLVVFSYLMSKLLTPYISPVLGSEALLLLINTVIITIVVLLFGEFLPKTIFRLYADKIMYYFAVPLRIIKFLLSLPTWLMLQLSNRVLRLFFKSPVEDENQTFTRADLEIFVKTSIDASDEDIDADLFENALQLRNIRVRDCMIPRTEIIDIDIQESLEELRKMIIDTKLSRIIVSDGDIDNIKGYAHHHSLHLNPTSIKDVVMDIPIVPETMPVQQLMNWFIRDRINIACVVDEYGGTAGIITLEDMLEEVFGEIADEHDQEEHVENQISEREFVFSGRLEIGYLNDKYEILELPEGEYNTLSGYLVTAKEMIPEKGAKIELEGYRFILEMVSETKIELIRVIKMKDPDEAMD